MNNDPPFIRQGVGLITKTSVFFLYKINKNPCLDKWAAENERGEDLSEDWSGGE